MTTSTLNPVPTKKVNLNQIVGGTFEAVADSVFGEAIKTPIPEYVEKAFSGSIEGFNEPRPKPVKNEEQLIETQRAYLRHYNIVAEATKVVEKYQAKQEVEDQVRLEIAGMSDEERAVEGNYQANYRGASLKKIYNTMWIFFKKVATKLAGQRKQTAISIAETKQKGKSAMQGMFEGASGQIGKGQGNISFQAAG